MLMPRSSFKGRAPERKPPAPLGAGGYREGTAPGRWLAPAHADRPTRTREPDERASSYRWHPDARDDRSADRSGRQNPPPAPHGSRAGPARHGLADAVPQAGRTARNIPGH